MSRIYVLLAATLVLASCASAIPLTPEQLGSSPPGFLYGLWHGLIFGFAFVVSLFDDSVAVYAVNNSGGWYDFGFMLGIGLLNGTATKTVTRTIVRTRYVRV